MYGSYDSRPPRAARVRLAASGATVGAMLLLAGCFSSSDDSSDDGAKGGSAVDQRPKSESPYWVNPSGNAAKQVSTYEQDDKADDAKLIKKIASQPVADWITRPEPRSEVERLTKDADKADRSALLVLYNLPHRDCGQYSQGGAKGAEEYRAWLDNVVKGIGDRSTTVVVEPDAIPHLLAEGCTPKQFHEERYQLLNEAVSKLKQLPKTKVYLDAGNPDWVRDPGGLVEPLNRAGIAKADGFALNVSNYQTTKSNRAYGNKVSPMVGNKPFVIDTSRNGNGPVKGAGGEESWCNPRGRALGEPPTTKTGDKRVDAYLWIKRPGESDGECKGGPKAGQWWPKYALELARNAKR
ncbi:MULTISPECIES: glycoside hydrolase family 6 protein [unclassified Streptomyces]|uniref:glycoside hydrolase family 6 protein n=1 Tax=unclassified Streptomyces TaxID=2593676 RepID=UPI002DDB7060|nr:MULTISPECIES: glycoside hydrolase family 6 protein [unclassified Streptomyces]WSA94520.1 glycoside hydrolase family 6 protein [Streptomyces sp. NBC_01795]WSB78939.1 glycoside hydrolase family 6 protein [Streptomyces sp. NBC_01775]WSS12859.1 glycoside hydrolase family 6 protein [Streptomyces sp. NBC_01186]WSS41643.1 glycoside hydrolase family 6 protein [Streptomyces sp. NBC_01187]